MEFSYLFLYLVLIVLILTGGIYLFKLRHNHKSIGDQENLPPRSLGWPLIGETIEFLKVENFMYDRIKQHSPDIFKTKILREETAVLCGPNGNKFLFSNEQNIFTAFRPRSMQKLFRSYNNHDATPINITCDAEVQIMKAPGFLKPEALVGYVGKMDSITQQQMRIYWEGKDEVNTFSLTKTLTLTLSCRFFMGTEDPELVAMVSRSFYDITLGMHSISVNFPRTKFYKASKAAVAVRKELRVVIGEKKVAMASGEQMVDILSRMIVATDGSGKHMPKAEIADKIMGLLVAGYSTVAIAMTFFVKYVRERPDIYHKVLAEQREIAASKKPRELLDWNDMQKMKYSWNVLCEVMRLTPPLQRTFREALTDFTYAGYTIPKGWKVYWTASTTNKNQKYFPDPEKFDPSRHDKTNNFPAYTFVPFGGGPRMCPGKEYARLVILTFVHNLVKRFKWEMVLQKERIIGDIMPIPEKGLPIRLYHH